jgi:hypothetical protein
LSGWLNPKFEQLKIPSQPETIFVSQPAETKLTALNFFVKPKRTARNATPTKKRADGRTG